MSIDDLIKNNTAKILEDIEQLVASKNLSYIDAIVLWTEKYNVEIETIAPIFRRNSKFKGILSKEAEDLNYLPKTQRLPE